MSSFRQPASLTLTHTHAHRRSASLVLKYFWLAEVVSSRSLFYFVSNFRVWGSCLALPSSPSFCSAFIKHSARAAVTRRRLLFIVTHPEAKFLLYFVHCHFRSSQSQPVTRRKMLGDDAMGSNRSTLCNVAHSARLPGIPPFSYACHILRNTQ